MGFPLLDYHRILGDLYGDVLAYFEGEGRISRYLSRHVNEELLILAVASVDDFPLSA